VKTSITYPQKFSFIIGEQRKLREKHVNQVHLENGREHMDSQVVVEAQKTHTHTHNG